MKEELLPVEGMEEKDVQKKEEAVQKEEEEKEKDKAKAKDPLWWDILMTLLNPRVFLTLTVLIGLFLVVTWYQSGQPEEKTGQVVTVQAYPTGDGYAHYVKIEEEDGVQTYYVPSDSELNYLPEEKMNIRYETRQEPHWGETDEPAEFLTWEEIPESEL